jgi:hypothetical protein
MLQGRRWSKLQSRLYDVVAPETEFQIHCRVYRMQSQSGSTGLPRYWITVGEEIVWDYPRQFMELPTGGREPGHHYPYNTDVNAISNLIEEYLNTPREDLLTRRFDDDHWGLINILRAADRRFGTRQLPDLKRKTGNPAARKVLAKRFAAKVRL